MLLWLGGGCGNPARPADRGRAPAVRAAYFQVAGPASVVVHEEVLLGIAARDAQLHPIDPAGLVVFSSSDTTVLSVSASGVVRGVRRGSATITARFDALTAVVTLSVVARAKILPDYLADWPGYWPMAIGDTLRFQAIYVDIDGFPIADLPESPVWSSSNPDWARVETGGQVIAVAPSPGGIKISAGTADGTAFTIVEVLDVDTRQPATIRFAHAAKGVGPITFVPNIGDPVTLAYGEFVDRQIRPGPLDVHVSGLTEKYFDFPGIDRYTGIIRPGDRVALYAAGGRDQAWVAQVWDTPADVPADSGIVRIVQGWTQFGVVSLAPSGALPSGVPELCYFDPGDVSRNYLRAAGPFDLILEAKYGGHQSVRLPVAAAAGQSVTLVLTGYSAADVGVLTFHDQ